MGAGVTAMRYTVSMTPVELADELGIAARSLRSWLRRTYPRSDVEHGQRWHLEDDVIRAARSHFQ